MPTDRLRPLFPLLCAALVFGLSGCKQSTDATTPAQETGASAADKVAAVADAVNPMASPREEVVAAMRKLMDARSYRAEMQHEGGPSGTMTNTVEFVAPDRFRMEMAGVGTQYVIGDTMTMTMDGRTMQVPMPKGTVTQWRDPVNFREAEASMTAQALGNDAVDGIQARKYLVHQTTPKPADFTIWIGADGLPLQMRVSGDANGQPVTTTVRYSRINDPGIVIEAPK